MGQRNDGQSGGMGRSHDGQLRLNQEVSTDFDYGRRSGLARGLYREGRSREEIWLGDEQTQMRCRRWVDEADTSTKTVSVENKGYEDRRRQ